VSLPLRPNENLVLIGMPWSGKSTIGVLVAKALARPFLDTDVVIQSEEGCLLQDIVDAGGPAALRAIEERHVLALKCRGHVIATGGSVVYSDSAMRHLKEHGLCLYLHYPLASLEARATRFETRGLVCFPGQTLADLYEERTSLYTRYAGATLSCEGLSHEQVVDGVLGAIDSRGDHS